MSKFIKFVLFVTIFVACGGAEIAVEETAVTSSIENSSPTEISSCEENILVMKSIFEVIKDITLSSIGVENVKEKLELFQINKEYLTEVGFLVANVSTVDSEQLDIKSQLEEYRLLAYSDAEISYELLVNAVDMEDPLWRQFTIIVNDLFALQDTLSTNLENYECD
tara:strand:- start:185 stop:682 length:498 start_codon:yes stop_codon:yes gene_type:complete